MKTTKERKIQIGDYPLIAALEDQFWAEIDRQFMDGEIDSGAMGSAYVDPVAGEINGRPNIALTIIKMLEAYWAEEEH